MLGQAHHFRIYATQKHHYAIQRYTNEAGRLYAVLDRQLGKTGAYVAGSNYTIADIAIFPWARTHSNHGVELSEFSNVAAWFDRIAARPAVRRGVKVLADLRKPGYDKKARQILFGSTQYQRR
ncbi:MAG: glutathione binding-like protein, partial [Quisquiliibacterium sp.]